MIDLITQVAAIKKRGVVTMFLAFSLLNTVSVLVGVILMMMDLN
jgi:hypothetical protein